MHSVKNQNQNSSKACEDGRYRRVTCGILSFLNTSVPLNPFQHRVQQHFETCANGHATAIKDGSNICSASAVRWTTSSKRTPPHPEYKRSWNVSKQESWPLEVKHNTSMPCSGNTPAELNVALTNHSQYLLVPVQSSTWNRRLLPS